MDETKIVKLKVLERSDELIDSIVEEKAANEIPYPNQTNPIYRKMMDFHNRKIGDKFSIKDLLR